MFQAPFSNPFKNPFPSLGAALVFLLRDEFTTAQSAPLTSPRTCEPGPGTITVIDTGNKFSISSGTLILAGAVAGTRFYGSVGITRAVGVMFESKHKLPSGPSGSSDYFGLSSSSTFAEVGLEHTFMHIGGNKFRMNTPNAIVPNIDSFIDNTYYKHRVVMRSSGAFWIIDNTLLWVSASVTTTPMYAGFYNRTGIVVTFENAIICQLSSPFNSDTGIATNVVASPTINDTTTQTADAIVEMTWSAVTGQTWNLMLRRTDDNNACYVRCAQGTSTIKLIEKNAGVETERSSASQTWTNGTNYRVVVILSGNNIITHVNDVSKNSYSSASFNNTATGVKTDRAGTNLITWPRTLPATALTELSRWSA